MAAALVERGVRRKGSQRMLTHHDRDGPSEGTIRGAADMWTPDSPPRLPPRPRFRLRGCGLLSSMPRPPRCSFHLCWGLPVPFCCLQKGCLLKLCFWKDVPGEKAELIHGTRHRQ